MAGRVFLVGVGGQIIGAPGTGTAGTPETSPKRIKTDTGLSSKTRNLHDRKEYLISTALSPSGLWETAVFGKTLTSTAKLFNPIRVLPSHVPTKPCSALHYLSPTPLNPQT